MFTAVLDLFGYPCCPRLFMSVIGTSATLTQRSSMSGSVPFSDISAWRA
jgi:hypothetical protein